jgi:hypothetical protein
VDAESLELEGSAGGEIVAEGSVDRLTTRLTAGGALDTAALVARVVRLEGSAGGVQRVTATAEITGRVASGSEARVHGSPAVRAVTTASGGRVRYEE